MADITRDQFNEGNRVTKKILQKGAHVLDSDWNEFADIFRYGDRRALSCMVSHTSKRFGDGFKVVGTGASLAVTVKAGWGAFVIDTELAVLLNLAEDLTVSGFSAWTGARTDYVYADIEEVEIAPADDPNIINPDLGVETCRDLRLVYSLAISEGSEPGAAPAGHTYVLLASVTKDSGSNIEVEDVTRLIDDHHSGDDIWPLFNDSEYSRDSNSDAAALAAYYSESSGTENANTVIRCSLPPNRPAFKTLHLSGWMYIDSGATNAKVQIQITSGQTPYSVYLYDYSITGVGPSLNGNHHDIAIDIEGLTNDSNWPYKIEVVLYVTGSAKKLYLIYPSLFLSKETGGAALTQVA